MFCAWFIETWTLFTIVQCQTCIYACKLLYATGSLLEFELCTIKCACILKILFKLRTEELDATNSDLLVINSISTCFGHLYAHHQEIRLRSTAYSCLSCCSCCDAGESGDKMCALCGECCLTHSAHISITTATTGQTTIGSGTQSDILMMCIKMPETCWDTIGYQ